MRRDTGRNLREDHDIFRKQKRKERKREMRMYSATKYGATILSIFVFVTAVCSAITTNMLTFQEGAAGYAGTHDTWFASRSYEYGPNGSETTMKTGKWSIYRQEALVRFGDVFGSGTNQLRKGYTIISAELVLTVSAALYADGEPNNVHKMLVGWDESTAAYTNSSFGGNGVQTDDAEASIRIYDDGTRYTNSMGDILTGTMMTFNACSAKRDIDNYPVGINVEVS